ncbi:UNVERIFIED_CONTAM: protein MATERNALLY EXPRESSED5 [Sesamum calycinum]|uniref:Protein MATERNALLY EXPRESSED5 n=1 Tax=Sesamum calycinum TaxID=2727403 RepID=A0AAW2RSL8_9LAMI
MTRLSLGKETEDNSEGSQRQLLFVVVVVLLRPLEVDRAAWNIMPSNHFSTYNVPGDYQGRSYRDTVSQMPTDAYHAHHDGRGHSVHMQHGPGYYSRENYWDRNHARPPYDHYLPSGSSFAPARTGGGMPHIPLPPNACSTLYVEGLPANSTRREVAHIFRPFVGYLGLRLVSREARQVMRQGQWMSCKESYYSTALRVNYMFGSLRTWFYDVLALSTRFWNLAHFPVQALDHVLKETVDHVSVYVSISAGIPDEKLEHSQVWVCLLNGSLQCVGIVAQGSLSLSTGSALRDGHGMRFSYASITDNRALFVSISVSSATVCLLCFLLVVKGKDPKWSVGPVGSNWLGFCYVGVSLSGTTDGEMWVKSSRN